MATSLAIVLYFSIFYIKIQLLRKTFFLNSPTEKSNSQTSPLAVALWNVSEGTEIHGKVCGGTSKRESRPKDAQLLKNAPKWGTPVVGWFWGAAGGGGGHGVMTSHPVVCQASLPNLSSYNHKLSTISHLQHH